MERIENSLLLNEDKMEDIHKSTLRILEKIGIQVPNQDVLRILQKEGARVDFQTQTAKLPAQLVESCVQKQLENNRKNRRDNSDSSPSQKRSWMATQPYILDYNTYERRPGELTDLLQAIVVGDRLPFVEKVSCFVIPDNYPQEMSDALSFYLLYRYSSKRRVFSWLNSLKSAECVIAMARVVAENEEQFQSGDLVEYNVETISPLRFASHSLEIMLECAKHKVRMSCGPMLMMGASAPMNHLSTMTLENAEILATLVTIILLNPDNYSFSYIAPAHSMNMQNGICSFGSPNQVLFALIGKQIADYYGFDQIVTNCGLSDGILSDFQSGFERGVTSIISFLAGIDQPGLMGIAGADQAASLEQLVIDHEYLSYINFILSRDLANNIGGINLDLIRERGCGGDFIDISRKQSRDVDFNWHSAIFTADTYPDYLAGGVGAAEKARETIKGILQEAYPPQPAIKPDQCLELDTILKNHLDTRIVERFAEELELITKSDSPND